MRGCVRAGLPLAQLLLAVICMMACKAGAATVTARVHDPYLELRTGPGRGYPVFYVVEQGERIRIDKRRTDWFRVETLGRHAHRGWVHVSQLTHTVDVHGALLRFEGRSLADVVDRRWEWSVAGGDFGGASSISTGVACHLTRNIAVQLRGTQILGSYSNGEMLDLSVQEAPFPEWRVSPWFQLGTGLLRTSPHATIVQSADRTDHTLDVGAGVNLYLARRFILFVDYRYHNVLTRRETNQEISEWKIGFNIFF